MTQKFKSDARPSDTKSVTLHKQNDHRLLDHLEQLKGQTESYFWRQAGYFYLDFADWLATQPNSPPPGRPWVYYQTWLENRSPAPLPPCPPAVDPDALLPAIRDVVEAALSTALAGLSLPPRDNFELYNELDDLRQFHFSDELVLDEV